MPVLSRRARNKSKRPKTQTATQSLCNLLQIILLVQLWIYSNRNYITWGFRSKTSKISKMVLLIGKSRISQITHLPLSLWGGYNSWLASIQWQPASWKSNYREILKEVIEGEETQWYARYVNVSCSRESILMPRMASRYRTTRCSSWHLRKQLTRWSWWESARITISMLSAWRHSLVTKNS